MLLNWFLSSISENNHLKNLFNLQDLKNLGIQYCTHLLAAGVLRQISDKDAPTENIFKPNLMYYWAHMEAPASQPVTPGRLHMAAWPPDKELLPHVTQDLITNRCSFENKFFNQNNNEEISDINEAKLTISQLKQKLQELEYQLEKYKWNAQVDARNKNLDKNFDSSAQTVSKAKVELINKEVQTSYEINKLSYRPVIISDTHLKSNVNIDSSVVLSSCAKDIVLKNSNRSEKIENYCKLNKSRDYNQAIRTIDVPMNVENNAISPKDVKDDNAIGVNRNVNKCIHHPNNSATCIMTCCCCSSDASFLSALTSCDSINNENENIIETDDITETNLTKSVITEMLYKNFTNEKSETSQHSLMNISSGLSSETEISGSISKLKQNSSEVESYTPPASLSPPSSSATETESILVKPSLTSHEPKSPPPPLPGMAPSPPPTPGTKVSPATKSASGTTAISESVPSAHEKSYKINASTPSIKPVGPLAPSTPEIAATKSSVLVSGASPPLMPELVPESEHHPSTTPGMEPPPFPVPEMGPTPHVMPETGPPPPPIPETGSSPPAMPGIGPPSPPPLLPSPPPMPGMGPPPPPMPGMGPPPPPMPGMGLPPPPMPGMGPPPPPMPGMGPPSPPMPGMGPPPPPMPGMGPPPPPMPGMGPPPPPMPGMGPPPPPMPGMGPPPPPMPGMGPPPPPMPGTGPPPPPMPGMGPPPPPMPGASPLPPPMPGLGPPPPPSPGPPPPPGQQPYTGPVPFPAPPVGGWTMQRSTLRKTPVKPAAPMKPLYWTRILANQVAPTCHGESDSVPLKPLWLEIEETKLDNIEEFTDLFSRQVVKAPVKKKVEVKTKIQPVKILDSKRSQNVGILAQSLHVEFSEIENAIYNFDTSVVSLEALQQIYELRASDEELCLIKEHLKTKSEVPLDRPEAFLHDLSGIPNFAERISCFMFQAEFEDAASTTMHKLDNLKHTCEFLMTSESLKKLFAIILTLGNYMNGGNGQRGQADGFGLEILSKLKDVKSKQSNVTLLHFIVRTYMREQGGALSAACALPVPEPGDVARAAALDFADVAASLATLSSNLAACKEKSKKVIETDAQSRSHPDESPAGEGPRRLEVFKEKMSTFLDAAEDKLKTEYENLEDCRSKFIATIKFYQYTPKCGKVEDCEPKEFFSLWTSFCSDFKDIYKKEEQLAIKEKLKEAKKMQEERKSLTQPKKEGGLKARLQKLSSTRK